MTTLYKFYIVSVRVLAGAELLGGMGGCVYVCCIFSFVRTCMHTHTGTHLLIYYSWLSKPEVHGQQGRKEGS